MRPFPNAGFFVVSQQHPAFISRPPRRHPFQRTPRPNPPSTTTGGAPQRARGPRWDCQHGAAQRQRRQGAAIPALGNGASGSYCRLGFGRMVCPGQMGPIWGGILRKTIMCRRLTGPPRTIGQAVYPTAIWPLTYYLVVSDIDGAWSYPQMQQKTGVKTPLNGHSSHVGKHAPRACTVLDCELIASHLGLQAAPKAAISMGVHWHARPMRRRP